MMKKRWMAGLLALWMAAAAPLGVWAEEDTASQEQEETLSIEAKAAVLADLDSGQVLWAMNENEPLAPASVTKIMTLLLVMEALERGDIRLEDMVVCSAQAAAMGGSQIWLEEGEEMTVDDLLKAVAVYSANDAAVALAQLVAGSEEAFVAKMNEKAASLGMEGTTFRNCTGLDEEGHLTTAADIATMSAALMDHSPIIAYTTIWMDTLRDGETQLVNTNELIHSYEGATGLKTGTTPAAGNCLAATASRDGLNLVAVVLGSETSQDRFDGAEVLLDYGFSHFCRVEPGELPQPLGPVPVTRGAARQVEVTCTLPETVLIEEDQRELVTLEATLDEQAEAPVEEGQRLGTVTVLVDGQPHGECPVTAAEAVPRMTLPRAFRVFWEATVFLG